MSRYYIDDFQQRDHYVKIRVCFENEICPGYCEHSSPAAAWSEELEYQPLTINVRSGPYFYVDSVAIDFQQLVEVEQNLPSEESDYGRSAYLERE